MEDDVEVKEKQAMRDERARWLPGYTPPGAGRPLMARQRLGEKFISVLAADFEIHGQATIEKLRETDPARYAQIVASLMPKALEIAIQQRGPLDREEMVRLRELVDMIDAAGAANVADSETVLGWIDEDLRARLAVPVDSK